MTAGSSSTPGLELSAGVVDLEALSHWMDSQGLQGDSVEHVRLLGGGTQNVMLRFTRGGRDFVLRRGPAHLRASTNTSLCREMRILAALRGSAVPHPQLIAGCEDTTVLGGSVFYLMEPVEGFNAATTLPQLHAHDASIRHEMGLAMVDAIAELGRLDYRQAGLADYGRPDGFLERQVPRWTAELHSYQTHYEYDTESLPGVAQVARWLQANLPAISQPGVLHGDFHVANVMFEYSSPAVAAVVDWEMSTVGDPVLDLGWLIATWPLPGDQTDITAHALGMAGGLASVRDLVERYANRSGRDVTHVQWYTVLACFKLGIVLEGSYARAGASKAPREIGERLHRMAVGLLDRAVGLVQGDETL